MSGVACAIAGQAGAAQRDMEQRLQAVEAKTSFYTPSSKKVVLQFRKGQPIAKCNGKRLTIPVDAQLAMGGLLYSWPSLTVRFKGFPGPARSAKVQFFVSSKPTNLCETMVNVGGGNATLALKLFCGFEAAPGDKINFAFDLYSDADPAPSACDSIVGVDFSIKTLSIGIREPD